MPSSSLTGPEVDFILVTALAEERDAVLGKLPGYRQLSPADDDIRTYFQADLPVTFPDKSTGKYCVVAICLMGMGRLQAATATADAIRRWHPRYIVLVGIAGGMAVRRVQIGDILISNQIVDYELQKLTPKGPEVRWEVQRADPRLLNACNNFRGESWQKLITVRRPDRRKPKRHVGPIASGDKVIAFGEVLARYCDVWPKLVGIEMEAAGVATAAFQSPDKPGFLMVRGVSDLADENKDSKIVEKWRSYACAVAASFVVALLRSGPVPLSKATEPLIQAKTKRVDLVLEEEFDEFTSSRQQDTLHILAVTLGVEPNSIRVLKVQQGSIEIALEMPDSAANLLYEMAAKHDLRIARLNIKSVLVEGKAIIHLGNRTTEIPGNKCEQLQSNQHQHRRARIESQVQQLKKLSVSLNSASLGHAGTELMNEIRKALWKQAHLLQSAIVIRTAIHAKDKKKCILALRELHAREGSKAKRYIDDIINDPNVPQMVRQAAKDVLRELESDMKHRLNSTAGQSTIQENHGTPTLRTASPNNPTFVLTQVFHNEDTTVTTEDDSIHIERTGQIGAVGREANLQNANFIQQGVVADDIDLQNLARDLMKLRDAVKKQPTSEPERDITVGAIASAEKEALQGNKTKTLEYLAKVGAWVLDIAKSIGADAAAAAIKSALGLP